MRKQHRRTMRGDVANPPCISCSKGSGPFPVCVTVTDALRGSCASCHYGGEGSRCSFRKSRKLPNICRRHVLTVIEVIEDNDSEEESDESTVIPLKHIPKSNKKRE